MNVALFLPLPFTSMPHSGNAGRWREHRIRSWTFSSLDP